MIRVIIFILGIIGMIASHCLHNGNFVAFFGIMTGALLLALERN